MHQSMNHSWLPVIKKFGGGGGGGGSYYPRGLLLGVERGTGLIIYLGLGVEGIKNCGVRLIWVQKRIVYRMLSVNITIL